MAELKLQSFEGEELPELTVKEQEILRRYKYTCLTVKTLMAQLLSAHLDLSYREVNNIKYSIVQLGKQKSKLVSKFYRSNYQDINRYV